MAIWYPFGEEKLLALFSRPKGGVQPPPTLFFLCPTHSVKWNIQFIIFITSLQHSLTIHISSNFKRHPKTNSKDETNEAITETKVAPFYISKRVFSKWWHPHLQWPYQPNGCWLQSPVSQMKLSAFFSSRFSMSLTFCCVLCTKWLISSMSLNGSLVIVLLMIKRPFQVAMGIRFWCRKRACHCPLSLSWRKFLILCILVLLCSRTYLRLLSMSSGGSRLSLFSLARRRTRRWDRRLLWTPPLLICFKRRSMADRVLGGRNVIVNSVLVGLLPLNNLSLCVLKDPKVIHHSTTHWKIYNGWNLTKKRLIFRSPTWRRIVHPWLHFFLCFLDGDPLPSLLGVSQIGIQAPRRRFARVWSKPKAGQFTLHIEGACGHDRILCSRDPQGQVFPHRCSFTRLHFGLGFSR